MAIMAKLTDGNELEQRSSEMNGSDASSSGPGQRLDVHEVRNALQQVADTQAVDVLQYNIG